MPKRHNGAAEAAIVTLGQLVENGLGLRPFCACGRAAVIPPERLGGYPGDTPLERFKARLTCAACGRTGIDSAHVVSMAALGAYPHEGT